MNPHLISSWSLTRRQTRSERRHTLTLEQLEERCLLSVDPILEWNAVAIEVNRVSYSGGVVNDQFGPTRSSRAPTKASGGGSYVFNPVNPSGS